jgi:hypothetical protein
MPQQVSKYQISYAKSYLRKMNLKWSGKGSMQNDSSIPPLVGKYNRKNKSVANLTELAAIIIPYYIFSWINDKILSIFASSTKLLKFDRGFLILSESKTIG